MLENYPGFISIDSRELLDKFRSHAQHFGAEIIKGEAISFNLASDPKFVTTRDTLIEAKAVVIATGKPISSGKLIPGEERLLGMGVSYCSTCDGPLYRGSKVAAVGNSDEAAEDVRLLDRMGCKVLWIQGDRNKWNVARNSIAEIKSMGIPLYPKTIVKEIVGEQRVEKVVIEREEKKDELEVAGVFIFREIPTAPLFAKAGIELDHKQCIKVDRFQRTNLKGVFAAGDVTCGGMQIISAAGEGCVAAMQAIMFLR
jgi:thioredoxin reductase (NADPH)